MDLHELERLAASGRDADLEAAASLARGPFLAGFAIRDSPDFDDWQAARAARVEHVVGDVLDRLAAARSDGGDPTGAIEAARRRVDLDPLDEAGQRRVMELLARSGDRAGAVRQYRSLVALFDRELGVAPLRETTELYDAIREGRLEADEAPAAAAARAARRVTDAVPAAALGSSPLDRSGSRTRQDRRGLACGDAIRTGRPARGRGRHRQDAAGRESSSRPWSSAGGLVLAARGYPGEDAIAYGPIAELLRAGLAAPGGAERLATLDGPVRSEIGRLIDLPAELRATETRPSAESTGSRVRLLEAIARRPVRPHDGSTCPGSCGSTTCTSSTIRPGRPWRTWPDGSRAARSSSCWPGGARTSASRRPPRWPTWRACPMPRSVATPPARPRWRRRDRPRDAPRRRHRRRADRCARGRLRGACRSTSSRPSRAATGPARASRVSVHALLLERIASVSETAGQLLSAAAIIGRSFELSILRHASGRSEEETIDAIEELIHRGLVREVAGRAGPSVRYDFTHGRMRDVAYETTSLARRRLSIDAPRTRCGKRRPARTATTSPGSRSSPRTNGKPGRTTEAAAAFVEAADRAEAVFANREAIDHLSSALALDPADAAMAHARIGELRARLGEYPGGHRLPRDRGGPRLARRPAGDRGRARPGPSPARATSLPRPATSAPSSPRTTSIRACAPARSSSAVSSSSVPVSPTRSPGMRSRHATWRIASTTRGSPVWPSGSWAGGVRPRRPRRGPLCPRTERHAGRGRPRSDVGDRGADGASPWSWRPSNDVDRALEVADEAIAACRRIGDRHLEAAVENHVADMLHEAGRPEASMAHLKRAVALFAEVGDPAGERDPGVWALAAW